MSEAAEKKATKKSKTKKKSDVRLPSKVLYGPALAILNRTHGKKYRQTITREGMEGYQPPFIVLSNHITRIDWILVGLAMRPHRLNAVISRFYYSVPSLVPAQKDGSHPKGSVLPRRGCGQEYACHGKDRRQHHAVPRGTHGARRR
ncbi:MAG: hypothetical protein E7554_00905 [Ruminococcaceae bacterium]|nr:hypothetical protein [Oscillospiraceae bacterium]